MNIYPNTFNTIAVVLNELDYIAEAITEDDTGMLFGSMPLYSTDNRLLGAVNWDEDQHPYFTPAEDDYDEDDPEDGESALEWAQTTSDLAQIGNFVPVVDVATAREVG